MLRKVGFDVKVEYPEFSEWLKPVFAAAEDDKNVPDMLIQNTSASLFDSSNALVANVHCKGSHSVYCNEEIDAMMAQTDTESSTRTSAPTCSTRSGASSRRTPSCSRWPMSTA